MMIWSRRNNLGPDRQALRNAYCLVFSFLFFVANPGFCFFEQDSKKVVDSLTAFAKRQFAEGKIDSAKDSFEAVLDHDSKDLPARIGLGLTYVVKKEWRYARNEFEKVLKISPDNLEGHYHTAIAYREMGKTKAWLFRAADWKMARIHFQKTLAADSSFKDVLHQFSILEEYDKEFEHALELAHAGLRLREDRTEHAMDLFKLYRHFISVADTGASFAWLRSHPSPYARYFAGELFRTKQRVDDAARVFEEMLQSDSSFPRQALFISLLRISMQRSDWRAAEHFYWRAVDSIATPLGAELVFDDIKYIMNDEELSVYRSLVTLEKKRSFFRFFWNLRNPLAGSQSNARLIEHYRRMQYVEENFQYYGFRIWFNNPDKTAMLHFPETFGLNDRFSDKGLIYLRHGPPNEIERAAGLGTSTVDPNESWLYFPTQQSPKWIFHFVAIDGNWRLAPLPTDTRMYDALAPWDSRYSRLSNRNQMERLTTSETLADIARENVTVALSTDEHDWKRDLKQFRIVCSVDAFRSDNGRSLLNISYAIPMPVIAGMLPANAQRATCEVGISITSLTARTNVNKLDTMSFPIRRRSPGFITNLLRYAVKPDSYNIALHVHPLGVEAFGKWTERKRVEDFSSHDVVLSDVQFLMPSSSASSIEINGMKVIQVPFSIYQRGTPVYVYYQVFNLATIEGRISFAKEYFLTPADDTKGERRVLLMKADREIREESSTEFDALNIDSVKPGTYTLSVRVTDRHRVKYSERSRVIELVE